MTLFSIEKMYIMYFVYDIQGKRNNALWMFLLFAYVCVFERKCVFVQVGQLSPYPPADTFNISLSRCLIMSVIKSTLLFDSLSLCEADKIFYLFVFKRKYVSHKAVISFTRSFYYQTMYSEYRTIIIHCLHLFSSVFR